MSVQNIARWELFADSSSSFAYARNDADNLGRPLYAIMLCTKMFDQTRDMQNIVEEYSKKPRNEVTMNNLESAGGKFLHELMHIDLITNQRGHCEFPSTSLLRLPTALLIYIQSLINSRKTVPDYTGRC